MLVCVIKEGIMCEKCAKMIGCYKDVHLILRRKFHGRKI